MRNTGWHILRVASDETRSEENTEKLEATLRELLAPDRLPPYLKSARYELGTDHIGEPAVRSFLAIKPESALRLEKSRAELRRYSEFKQALSSRILETKSGYFPFIRFEEAA